jgi:hypothetical protein
MSSVIPKHKRKLFLKELAVHVVFPSLESAPSAIQLSARLVLLLSRKIWSAAPLVSQSIFALPLLAQLQPAQLNCKLKEKVFAVNNALNAAQLTELLAI